MQVGILAAGAGSRLRAAGWGGPKPLLSVAGVPLIGHLLHGLAPLQPEVIHCIINSDGGPIADYVRRCHTDLQVRFIQQDTASSFESFTLLCAQMQDAPFLVTTVDTICPAGFLTRFVVSARRQPGVDMVLSLTTFIDDEKPLCVRLDRQQRVLQLGDAAHGSGYATSGFYYCAPSVRPACTRFAPRGLRALREFLARMLQHGYWLQGCVGPKMIDVDRPQDVITAERFLREAN